MKRLLKVMAVGLALSLVAMGAPVSAQAADVSCEIGFTGPDSQNMCTSTETYACTVTNENEVTIVDETDQVVASGTATTGGNTTGGSSSSGSVTNENGSTFVVTITNGNPQEEEGDTCVASLVVPATVTPTPTGGVTPTVQAASGAGAATGTPAVLAETSGDEAATSLAWTIGVLAVLAIAGITGLSLYRHIRR